VIYKILCKETIINDLYVGHTTNFSQRKSYHKSACENPNSSTYNTKLYKTIRENGGWYNWEMLEIDIFNLKDSSEAKIKENEYFVKLKANLNDFSPNNNKNVFKCDVCNTQNLNSKKNVENHINTEEHKKNIIKLEKNTNDNNFVCLICDFNCDTKWLWNRHIITKKHKDIYESFKEKVKKFVCICGKKYTTRQSLHTHKKICLTQDNDNIKEDDTQFNEKKIIMTLLQQNNQLQNQIIELCKEKSVTNINNTCSHVNSHNKTFNLNVFLNETCKDAMNIMDFIDSLKLQLSDLESVGRLGYVEGISNIIVKNLKQLDIHKRPVHCSDTKREVMYIKDEDKWEKENDEKKKLKKVIKRVADKNARLLQEFKAKYPDCVKSASPYSDQYNKLIVESMGGSGDNDLEKEEKIIKKIAKNVFIDKTNT
jgi:hypothetical protein